MAIRLAEILNAYRADTIFHAERQRITEGRIKSLPDFQAVVIPFVQNQLSIRALCDQLNHIVRPTAHIWFAQGRFMMELNKFAKHHESLQTRLRAILDRTLHYLPERRAPVCQGIFLKPETTNAAHFSYPATTVLCPKPHIGEHVFDLVDVRTDCLQNPRLCHVIGQAIVPPF